MKIYRPKEDIILDDDDYKNDNSIDEEEFNYPWLWQSIIDSITWERQEKKWDNDK